MTNAKSTGYLLLDSILDLEIEYLHSIKATLQFSVFR